ncbi:MAG: tetratricopeptide repeat protein [Patescibacteria group bacterium]
MVKTAGPITANDHRLPGRWPYLIILILGLLLYGRTMFFDFVYLDDNALILENYPIISRVQNIGLIFGHDVFLSSDRFYYRPLLNLSFMADAAVAGPLPVIFHLTNILLHVLAAGLLFYLLVKWRLSRSLALWLSLVFLAHPVLTQAVAWIPGRNDSLLAVFVLAAFLSFLAFSTRPRLLSYIAYLGFLFCALLTKESAVFLPVLVIFYACFVEPDRVAPRDRWLLAAGSAAVGALWFVMRHLALGGETTSYAAAFLDIGQNAPALLIYLGKLLWPFNLAVFPILADSRLWPGCIVLLLLGAAAWQSRPRRNRYFLFSLLWFLLFLLPSFIRVNGLPDFLEHRLYLSFIGFLLFLAELPWIRSLDFNRKNVKMIGVAILLILAALTWQHSAAFSDRLTFWQAAAQASPHSPLAQKNLGVMYYLDGDFSAAEQYYQRALALNPQESMVHNNLGVIDLSRHDYASAEQEFRRELIVNPRYDKALFNLGDLAYRQRRYDAAADFWSQALASNPFYQEAYQRLRSLPGREQWPRREQ